jgi:hypothetical protein
LGYILFFVTVHQLVYEFIKKIGLVLIPKYLAYVFVPLVTISFVNESLLRPYFPVTRNFFSDITSLVSFACYYMVGIIAMHRRDFLTRNAALAWPLSVLALIAMAIHFELSQLPLPITKTIVDWTVIFGLNGLFCRYVNIKLALTTALHNKLMEIYVIHQLTLLTAIFITTQLTDGILKICVIFILGYALAYLVALAKSYVKVLLQQGIHLLRRGLGAI